MLECLILYSLLERDLTTYKIRKFISEKFEIFADPSLGAVHPALNKLVRLKYIETSKMLSEGGQKSIFHKLTQEGKKYFNELFTQIISTSVSKIVLEIELKIIMLPKIKNDELKNKFFENALNVLELVGYDIRNATEKSECGYYKTSAGLLYKGIADLKSTVEKLKQESGL